MYLSLDGVWLFVFYTHTIGTETNLVYLTSYTSVSKLSKDLKNTFKIN